MTSDCCPGRATPSEMGLLLKEFAVEEIAMHLKWAFPYSSS